MTIGFGKNVYCFVSWYPFVTMTLQMFDKNLLPHLSQQHPFKNHLRVNKLTTYTPSLSMQKKYYNLLFDLMSFLAPFYN